MATNKEDEKLLFPQLSYKIVGSCFDVHNELGRFAREKQYADLLEKRFQSEQISHKREYRIGDSGNTADFLVDEKVLLELKTSRVLGREQFRQLQNYLQQTQLKLGLLVNFREKYLRPRRVLRIKDHS